MSSIYFTDEHNAFRQLVRKFVETEINPHIEAWEEAGIFPAHELFKKMGNLGLLGLTYSEAYGGGGVDYWYIGGGADEIMLGIIAKYEDMLPRRKKQIGLSHYVLKNRSRSSSNEVCITSQPV